MRAPPSQLPPSTPTYLAVGRMFIKSPMKSTLEHLEIDAKRADDDVTRMTTQRDHIQRRGRELQDNFEDMIKQFRG